MVPKSWFKKILYTGDTDSLDRCGQTHRYRKKNARIFSSSGVLVKREAGAAVHSTAEDWSTFLCIELHFTSFPCSVLHFKVEKNIKFQCTPIQFPVLHWTSLYSKLLIGSALQCTGLYCSPYYALQCTALGKVFKSLDIIKIYVTLLHWFSQKCF